jgi:hypothetical protein
MSTMWLWLHIFGDVPLPVPAEIDGRLPTKGKASDALQLLFVADAAVVLSPCSLLRVAEKVGAGHMMMMADLAAPHAAEE